MKKIAFLFLIYDEIENECLWNNFFKGVDRSKYSIYIHHKFDKQLSFFESYKLNNPIPTDYAESSLVKAQNLLLHEALKDQQNERFVFLSNSCIPLKSFEHIYKSVFSNDLCRFNAAKEEHIFERNRGRKLARVFGRENVKKASQWSILTRPIARILSTSGDVLTACFKPGKRDLADEYFYLSYLYYLGKEDQIDQSPYAVTDCSTFEFWNDKIYEFSDDFTSTHPENWDRRLKTYFNISTIELNFLLSAPCYFGRKFVKDCTVDGGPSIQDVISDHYCF